MKKIPVLVLLATIAFLSAVGVQASTSTVTILANSVSVSGASGASVVRTGGTLQMNATVLPSNATYRNVSWSVTNGTGSATINSSGLLAGSSVGRVTVKAIASDGSGTFGIAQINVALRTL